MKIELHRKFRQKGYSIGILYINGERICETLEDEDRGLKQELSVATLKSMKIKGQTAIPVGTYQVLMTYSPKYKRIMPLVSNVPAYEGVRIHSGNTNRDTEGCILCGRNTKKGMVTNSRYWTKIVTGRIQKAVDNKEQVTLQIYW